MPESTLGVGIIGVSPVRGWAATAHIPALRALPDYEIRALSAHSAESARAAGEAFGVSAVFSDHEQLVTQPGIDIVAVTVKVPHHRELVSAALAAGKAVYCEWPLGRDLDDARAMAALAAEQEVSTVVGLQARQAPAIESSRSCSATDTSARSSQRPWWGCRSWATFWSSPTPTCSTRQTGPTR
jgi:predicted dehydrogenase